MQFSHDLAVTALLTEILTVWLTLVFFAEAKNEAAAIGLLRLIKHKRFEFCLHLLSVVLLHLSALSKILLEGSVHFAQTSASVRMCKDVEEDISSSHSVLDNICAD